MCAYPSRPIPRPPTHPGPHAARATPSPSRSRVTKTLQPGQPGTTRWQHVYGDKLVCVRYREDLQANARYVTVELILETRPLTRQPPPPIVEATTEGPRELLIRRPALPNAPQEPPDPWEGWDWAEPPPERDELTANPRATRPAHRHHTGPWVHVDIAAHELTARHLAKTHGARWDPHLQAWHMPQEAAETLGWQNRIRWP